MGEMADCLSLVDPYLDDYKKIKRKNTLHYCVQTIREKDMTDYMNADKLVSIINTNGIDNCMFL